MIRARYDLLDAEGLGGGFSFYELGQPILNTEGLLTPGLPLEVLREYVWYTETGQAWRGRPPAGMGAPPPDAKEYLLGKHNGMSLYFCFETDRATTLDHELLDRLGVRPPALVYADINCLVDPGALAALGIRFKKIPRDIRKL